MEKDEKGRETLDEKEKLEMEKEKMEKNLRREKGRLNSRRKAIERQNR